MPNNIKIFLLNIFIFILIVYINFDSYRFSINPDGISYISIAQKYVNWDFDNAINGYWGPFFSWLMCPFIYLGIDPLLSAKLTLLLIGLMVLWELNKLIFFLINDRFIQIGTLVLFSIIIAKLSLKTITPDILFVYLSLKIINLLANVNLLNSRIDSIKLGVYGAFLYLTKSFGLPYFIVLFLIYILYNYSQKYGSRFLFLGILFFCLISVIWISLISSKYGYFTIGTSGKYNHELVGPLQGMIHGHNSGYLIRPPNNSAISAWEDPSYLSMKHWSPFESIRNLKYLYIKVYKNFVIIWDCLFEKNSMSLSFLIFGILYLKRKKDDIGFFVLVCSFFILIFGYSLVLVEDRYLWLGKIILIILGSKLIDIFLIEFRDKFIYIIFVIFIFTNFNPLQFLNKKNTESINFYNLSLNIKKLNIRGNIACAGGNYNETLYLSYFNSYRFYGESTNFALYKINYLFVWNNAVIKNNWIPIFSNDYYKLKIYKVM